MGLEPSYERTRGGTELQSIHQYSVIDRVESLAEIGTTGIDSYTLIRVYHKGIIIIVTCHVFMSWRAQVWWLCAPHALLGAGLGAADAALVPALLARAPRRVPQRAALLQAAASAAYALGEPCAPAPPPPPRPRCPARH